MTVIILGSLLQGLVEFYLTYQTLLENTFSYNAMDLGITIYETVDA